MCQWCHIAHLACIKRECTMKIRRDMTRISLLRRLFIFRSHEQNIRDTTRDSRKGHDNKNRGRRRRATFRHERGFSRGQRKRVCASRNNNLQLPRWYILQGRLSSTLLRVVTFFLVSDRHAHGFESRPTIRGNFRFGSN